MPRLKAGKSIALICALLLVSMSFSGCLWLVVSGVAATGGYAISQDTIQGETDKDVDTVWDATIDIVSILGTVSSQARGLGRISAIVNGAKVTIHVTQLTPSTVRLKVKARKALFPSIATAQNIFLKIMNRMNE